ncbi:MAG: efflux RND transporter periplasmic adaptor subunit [Bacteroidetes bacterium]|nr:efflux RND transporter periplasmic adaptor subunit [Bacteroidota bacterium]
MKLLKKIHFILVVALLLNSCSSKEKVAEQNQQKYTCPMHPEIVATAPGTCPICGMDLVPVGTASNDGSIMLNERQIKLANITTTLTRFENIGESIPLTGRVMVNEERVEVISSRVAGRIEKLFQKETGKPVKKGEPLYQLYSESLLVLQREYLLAVRQWEELKEPRFETFAKSAEKKLLLFGMSKEQVALLRESKKISPSITFLAPSSGNIARIEVTEGQYVAEGSAMYRLENLDMVWVEAEIYPGENQMTKLGDSVQVHVDGFKHQNARIIFVSPEFRKGSQVTLIRVALSNANGNFIPGMQATILLSKSERKALAIPTDAVLRNGNKNHVWIFEKDGTFRPRLVKTGLESFEKVEILEGLKEKENVVITGAYLLHSELVLKKGGYHDM